MFFWSPIIIGLLAFVFVLFVLFGIMGNREGWESLSRFAEAQGLDYAPGGDDAPPTLIGPYRGIPVEVTLGAGRRARTLFCGQIPGSLPGEIHLGIGAGAAVEGSVPLGDPKLDGRLNVRATGAEEARRILLHPKVRRSLVGFFERHPDATLRDGQLTFSRVGSVLQPVELKRELDDLVKFAVALETAGDDRDFLPPSPAAPAAISPGAARLEIAPELAGLLPSSAARPGGEAPAAREQAPTEEGLDPALAAALTALAAPDLDGPGRVERLEALSGRALSLTLTIDRIGVTFGGDVDASMKGGRTLYGAWGALPVTAWVDPAQSDAVDALAVGGEARIQATVVDWDALRGRLLLRGALAR